MKFYPNGLVVTPDVCAVVASRVGRAVWNKETLGFGRCFWPSGRCSDRDSSGDGGHRHAQDSTSATGAAWSGCSLYGRWSTGRRASFGDGDGFIGSFASHSSTAFASAPATAPSVCVALQG